VYGGASNLLRGRSVAEATAAWKAEGNARIENVRDTPRFVVRDGGSFHQRIALPENAAGYHTVVAAIGSSERINADGAITDLPYLYGYMMKDEGRRILSYLQGPHTRLAADTPNERGWMWGVFPVPAGTTMIQIALQQALANGAPHNGSAARFSDVGLFLFATEAEAHAFVARWIER
jgi:hypothetical protein